MEDLYRHNEIPSGWAPSLNTKPTYVSYMSYIHSPKVILYTIFVLQFFDYNLSQEVRHSNYGIMKAMPKVLAFGVFQIWSFALGICNLFLLFILSSLF